MTVWAAVRAASNSAPPPDWQQRYKTDAVSGGVVWPTIFAAFSRSGHGASRHRLPVRITKWRRMFRSNSSSAVKSKCAPNCQIRQKWPRPPCRPDVSHQHSARRCRRPAPSTCGKGGSGFHQRPGRRPLRGAGGAGASALPIWIRTWYDFHVNTWCGLW